MLFPAELKCFISKIFLWYPPYCSDLRMKLNERHFSFGTVYYLFWDKPYQEINLKANYIVCYFANKGKYVRFPNVPFYFNFCLCSLLQWNCKVANYESHWNILVFWDRSKVISDLNMSHGKMSDFVSFPLFRFTLVIKLRNFVF